MLPPEIITRYFNAANAGLIDDASDCFSPDAVVEDEGGVHIGSGAVRAWIHETTEKYQPQVEVLRSEQTGRSVAVTGRVSGDFPGSPVELDYQFTLGDETISKLSIE